MEWMESQSESKYPRSRSFILQCCIFDVRYLWFSRKLSGSGEFYSIIYNESMWLVWLFFVTIRDLVILADIGAYIVVLHNQERLLPIRLITRIQHLAIVANTRRKTVYRYNSNFIAKVSIPPNTLPVNEFVTIT